MTNRRPPYGTSPNRPQGQQRPQQRTAATDVVNPSLELGTAILGVLHDIAQMQFRTNTLLEDLIASQADDDLYCPPSEHCPGGLKLRRSTVFEDDVPAEKRRDKFYHPLPEDAWYDLVDANKTFHVRNHNVWRSQALAGGGDPVPAPPSEARSQPPHSSDSVARPAKVETPAAPPAGIAIAGSTITVETWAATGPYLRRTIDRFKGEPGEPGAAAALWAYLTEEITAREPGDIIRRAAETVRSFLRQREGRDPALYFIGRSDADAVDLREALALFEREWDAQRAEAVAAATASAGVNPADLPF